MKKTKKQIQEESVDNKRYSKDYKEIYIRNTIAIIIGIASIIVSLISIFSKR